MPPGVRILIAEDEDALRRALAAILRAWGHEVVEARDGREALTAASGEGPPDIAILDWDMPGLSGIEVCRDLRSNPELPYTYVILLTGKGTRDDRIEGLDAGADDYIVKPFDPRELAARLKTAARILGLRPSSAPIELVFGPPALEIGSITSSCATSGSPRSSPAAMVAWSTTS